MVVDKLVQALAQLPQQAGQVLGNDTVPAAAPST